MNALSIDDLEQRVEQQTEELQREVEARKRNEATLAQTEHLFRSFMDGIPDMIYFKDRRSRFIRANPTIAAGYIVAHRKGD